MIYLATPMASTKSKKKNSFLKEKLDRNQKIVSELRKNGFEVYLPQEQKYSSGKQALKEQLKVIRGCECLVIVLSDTRGAYLETGFAKALGKKVYALKVEETRKLSDWLESFFDFVAEDVEELVKKLSS